jgi:gamma-glutamylcyclotransferase (GGCT)/AIG2-like uncharacterized protein YtfP
VVELKERVGRIFAYGTLDKTAIFRDLVSSGRARFIGNGRIRAKLYDLGEYPGAVEHKRGYVHGRLYEVKGIDEVLPLLDEYEEFYPDKPESSLFIRKVMWAVMESGERVKAFVYLYNGVVEENRLIPKGVWDK